MDFLYTLPYILILTVNSWPWNKPNSAFKQRAVAANASIVFSVNTTASRCRQHHETLTRRRRSCWTCAACSSKSLWWFHLFNLQPRLSVKPWQPQNFTVKEAIQKLVLMASLSVVNRQINEKKTFSVPFPLSSCSPIFYLAAWCCIIGFRVFEIMFCFELFYYNISDYIATSVMLLATLYLNWKMINQN